MKKKEFVFARRAAEVPPGLDPVSEVDPDSSLRLEGLVLQRARLAERSFHSIALRDVRLVGCDLANVTTRALSLIRVEFVDCRLTGFTGGDVEAQDVLFSECDGRLTLRFSKMNKGVEFDSCQLEDADFGGTDLTGSVFRGCNLRNVEMGKARLMDADLRGSRVEGLHVGAEEVAGRGADRWTRRQAMRLRVCWGRIYDWRFGVVQEAAGWALLPDAGIGRGCGGRGAGVADSRMAWDELVRWAGVVADVAVSDCDECLFG